MANEQQVVSLYGMVWARSTPDIVRTSALYGLVWARPTPDIARVSSLYGVVWTRTIRTWDNIPDAIKVDYPGGITDPDEMVFYRHFFTISSGQIPSYTLQVVGEYQVRISLNGEADLFTYQAGESHCQIEAYIIPANKLVVGLNLLAFEVSPEEGRLQTMLEFKLSNN